MAGDVTTFNELPVAAAREVLMRCLALPTWVDTVLAGRPYDSREAVMRVASAATADLTADELDQALAGHPRIGERAGVGHDVAFSEREQSGVERGDADVAARLRSGNATYEARFGRVFLVRAAGRSSAQILDELDRRLANSADVEMRETVEALGEIAVLRLGQVV